MTACRINRKHPFGYSLIIVLKITKSLIKTQESHFLEPVPAF
mgnify:CR=1 FL=1